MIERYLTALRSLGLVRALEAPVTYDEEGKLNGSKVIKAAAMSASIFRCLATAQESGPAVAISRYGKINRVYGGKTMSLTAGHKLYTVVFSHRTSRLTLWDGVQEEPEEFQLEDYPPPTHLDRNKHQPYGRSPRTILREGEYWEVIGPMGYKSIRFLKGAGAWPFVGGAKFIVSFGKKPKGAMHRRVVDLYLGRPANGPKQVRTKTPNSGWRRGEPTNPGLAWP